MNHRFFIQHNFVHVILLLLLCCFCCIQEITSFVPCTTTFISNNNVQTITTTTTTKTSSSPSVVVLNLREKTDWFEDNPIPENDSSTENNTSTSSPSSQTSSSSNHNNNNNNNNPHHLRFLGKGKHAVVRPGVVLIAPTHEYHHFLMKSAIFIHAIGINEYGEHVTRGVIIDHPTAFTMGEMSAGSVVGVLGNNILFQGGDQGKDTAIMLHSLGDHPNYPIGCGTMIGTSGIYEGGLEAALQAADEGMIDPDQMKFFFNHVEFSDKELENMLQSEDSEGDAWISVEAPVQMILDSNLDRGDAWRSLRSKLKQMTMS